MTDEREEGWAVGAAGAEGQDFAPTAPAPPRAPAFDDDESEATPVPAPTEPAGASPCADAPPCARSDAPPVQWPPTHTRLVTVEDNPEVSPTREVDEHVEPSARLEKHHSAARLGVAAIIVVSMLGLLTEEVVHPDIWRHRGRFPSFVQWLSAAWGGLLFFWCFVDCLGMVVKREDADRLGRLGAIAGSILLTVFLVGMHWLRPGPTTDLDAAQLWFRVGTGLLVIGVVVSVAYPVLRVRGRSPKLLLLVALMMAVIAGWYVAEDFAARAGTRDAAPAAEYRVDEAERDVYEKYRFSIAGPGEGTRSDAADTEAALVVEYEVAAGEACLVVSVDVAPGVSNTREQAAEYLRGLHPKRLGETRSIGRLNGLHCAIIEGPFSEGRGAYMEVMYYVPGNSHEYYVACQALEKDWRDHSSQLEALAASFECW